MTNKFLQRVYAISFGGRSYWKARKIEINNDFSMAELIRNRPSASSGKSKKTWRLFSR